ncbi:4Fe-4S binding protein [Halobacteroides halobius]|uniref:4Fe-4S binding protein n=1 Tax=Halobacteroides halobius TaxID=42422 RepID=UPI003CCBAEA5
MKQVDWEKCIGCGCCVKACGCHILQLINTNQGVKAQVIDTDKCLGDKHCYQLCPTDALIFNYP